MGFFCGGHNLHCAWPEEHPREEGGGGFRRSRLDDDGSCSVCSCVCVLVVVGVFGGSGRLHVGEIFVVTSNIHHPTIHHLS